MMRLRCIAFLIRRLSDIENVLQLHGFRHSRRLACSTIGCLSLMAVAVSEVGCSKIRRAWIIGICVGPPVLVNGEHHGVNFWKAQTPSIRHSIVSEAQGAH